MLSLPNVLTLSRIVALPLLVALLWRREWEAKQRRGTVQARADREEASGRRGI